MAIDTTKSTSTGAGMRGKKRDGKKEMGGRKSVCEEDTREEPHKMNLK